MFGHGSAVVSTQILQKLIGNADFKYHGFCVIGSLKLLTISVSFLRFTLQQAWHKLSKVPKVTELHRISYLLGV